MPVPHIIGLLGTGVAALMAQVDLVDGIEAFGAFAVAYAFALWVIIQQRSDLAKANKERQERDKLILTQVVPMVTKATEALREASRTMAEQQKATDRLLGEMRSWESRQRRDGP